MKKFYTVLMAAAAIVSANAAQPGFTYAGPRNARPLTENPTQLRKINPISELPAKSINHNTSTSTTTNVDLKAINMWTTLGTGVIRDDAFTTFFQVEPRTWEVVIEKHRASEIYRIKDPYASDPVFGEDCTPDENRYMYLNAIDPDNVYFCDENGEINAYDTGVTIGSYGNLIMATEGYVEDNGVNGIFKNGYFSFPQYALIACLSNYNGGRWSYSNNNAKMRIGIPGAKDYDLAISSNYCVQGDKYSPDVTIGADLAAVKYLLLPYPYANAGWEEGILDDSADNPFAGADFPLESGIYDFKVSSVTERTSFMFILVGLDAEGNMVSSAHAEFIVDGKDDDQWETLDGNGKLHDNLLGLLAGLPEKTFDVQVQRHKSTPYYYRIVDPYTSGAWLDPEDEKIVNDNCLDHKHYLYINATDPDKVYVEDSAIGLNIFEMGDMRLGSYGFLAEYYKLTSSPVYGTMDTETGFINFPPRAINMSMPMWNAGDRMSHPNGTMDLQLPASFSGIGTIVTDSSIAPVEYYNLQGMRVMNPDNGIYIKKQGDKAIKVRVVR